MPCPPRCKLSHYSHPLSLYINRKKGQYGHLAYAACVLSGLCQRPTDSGLCTSYLGIHTSSLGIRTSGLCLRTSGLCLRTSDLRLSHFGLAPTPHQTYAYPTFRLVYAHIRAVPTHMRTCKQIPTSLYQRACIRYLRAPAFY